MKRDKLYLKNLDSLLDSMMSAANHKINSKVDNAIDKSATEAADIESEQIINSLWDRTFVSYAPEMVVRLPYYFQNNNFCPANTLGTNNQFKVNSMYDFDLTGVGHQPLGSDTWASIYDYYKVLETRLHFTWISEHYSTGTVAQTAANVRTDANAGANYLAPLYVGTMLDITANPPTTLTNWHEATRVTGNSQQRFTAPVRLEHIGSRKGTTQHATIVWKPEMFDTAVINQATENTWTAVGSDPQNLNYASDIVYNANVSTTMYYSLQVKAEMLVAFKNVKRSLLMTTN